MFINWRVGGVALLVGAVGLVTLADEPAGSGAASAEKYELKYQFRPGETVRWKVVHRATISTAIQGNQQSAQTRSSSTKAWKVTAGGAEGRTTFTHSVEDVEMWNQLQGRKEVTYNSRTDKEPPEGYEDVAKGVGVPLTEVTIDARGTIVSRVEKQAQPNSQPQQLTPLLPAEAVKVGYEWTIPHEIETKGADGAKTKVQTRQHCTLSKVEKGVAEIRIETQVLTPNLSPAIEAQLVQQLWNGTLSFNLAAGRVVAQRHSIDRRVVGFAGPASTMHYVMEQTEELLPETPETARRPK